MFDVIGFVCLVWAVVVLLFWLAAVPTMIVGTMPQKCRAARRTYLALYGPFLAVAYLLHLVPRLFRRRCATCRGRFGPGDVWVTTDLRRYHHSRCHDEVCRRSRERFAMRTLFVLALLAAGVPAAACPPARAYAPPAKAVAPAAVVQTVVAVPAVVLVVPGPPTVQLTVISPTVTLVQPAPVVLPASPATPR